MCWIWEELAWKNRVLQTENTLSCCLWTGYMRNFNTESNYIHHNLTKGKPWKTRTDTYGFSTFGILGFSMFLWWFVAVWSNCEWFTPKKKMSFSAFDFSAVTAVETTSYAWSPHQPRKNGWLNTQQITVSGSLGMLFLSCEHPATTTPFGWTWVARKLAATAVIPKSPTVDGQVIL